MNEARHKIVDLLKTLRDFFFVFVSVCVFNMGPKTTLLLPVWPRDPKRLDPPLYGRVKNGVPWTADTSPEGEYAIQENASGLKSLRE